MILGLVHYLEDMLQRLVLWSPIQQIIPVVAAGYLLLAVHNAENLKF
jgi:hypothetical protein